MNTRSNPQVNTELIARRAYEIWVGQGRPDGRALEHWRQAEREVLAAQAASGSGPAAVPVPAAPAARGANRGKATALRHP
jgi:hypothetical protein